MQCKFPQFYHALKFHRFEGDISIFIFFNASQSFELTSYDPWRVPKDPQIFFFMNVLCVTGRCCLPSQLPSLSLENEIVS